MRPPAGRSEPGGGERTRSLGTLRIAVYTIEYATGVARDLRHLAAYQRRLILDRIEQQLLHHPEVPTRNRKPLFGLEPPWEHDEPVWELRIGEHRVFYDVDDAEGRVVVRAIRHKPPGKTTEEIL